MYFSAQEMLAQLEGTDERICDLVIKNEIELFQTSRDEIMKILRNAIRSCTTAHMTPWKRKSAR